MPCSFGMAIIYPMGTHARSMTAVVAKLFLSRFHAP
jgi:hypothetical protein